jgi:hypothetical protein
MQFGLDNEYELQKQKAARGCFALTMNYIKEKLVRKSMMSDFMMSDLW